MKRMIIASLIVLSFTACAVEAKPYYMPEQSEESAEIKNQDESKQSVQTYEETIYETGTSPENTTVPPISTVVPADIITIKEDDTIEIEVIGNNQIRCFFCNKALSACELCEDLNCPEPFDWCVMPEPYCFMCMAQCRIQCSCGEMNAENIANIYVRHSGMQFVTEEYKIDLENGRFWAWQINWDEYRDEENNQWSFPKNRDETAENNGFDLICEFDADKISVFRAEADRFGFTSWNDNYYTDPPLMDGHRWIVDITFKNGFQRRILGNNAYPDTLQSMQSAFEALTGEKVLIWYDYG